MTDSDEKITYSLNVSTWAHPAGSGPVETSLVRASTPDPTVAAATLRAVADRLDPPRPAYRRGDHLRAAAGTRCAGDACNEGHTYRIGCLRAPAPNQRD